MKTIVITALAIVLVLLLCFVIFFNSEAETDQNRIWVLEMVFYPVGSNFSSYFIQIDEDNTIRVRYGNRRDFVVSTMHENLISVVRYDELSELSNDEMQAVLLLAQELETMGIIDETGVGSGTWEVVLIFNGVRYAMDYSLANIIVNHLGETFHEEAYSVEHYEAFLRLVEEIIQLSPIPVRMF